MERQASPAVTDSAPAQPEVERRSGAVADSLKKDRLPRDIHGVLSDYPYGGPIVGAAVTAAAEDNPNKPWTRVISDSSGGYTITHPPLGQAFIMVRCPRDTNHPDGPMAVSSVFVESAKPILFNMAIDRRNCDDPNGTPQGIPAPFDAPPFGNAADSARARSATYPSDEETAVYKTVLSGFARPSAGKISLIYQTTHSACEGTACADEYYRRIRFRPEVIMSTMDDFVSVRDRRLDFRDGFAGAPGYVLIGDSTLKLLGQVVGQSDVINNWSLIHLAYPEVERVVRLSPVAFSTHHKQAMVEVTRGSIDGLSRSELWIVEKRPGGAWRIVSWFR